MELLISLGLAGLVLLTAFSIYLTSTKVYRKTVDSGESHQNVRLISDYITSELRSARDISSDEASLRNENEKYYSLGLKPLSRGRFLIRETLESSRTELERTIGDSLSELLFLPSDRANMIRIRIQDKEGEQNYSVEFDIKLENISSLILPSEGVKKIYYAKYEE